MKSIVIGLKETAGFFGVTLDAVRKWVVLGCPKESRNQYDLKKVFDWWWNNIGEDRSDTSSGDSTLKAAKQKYWAAKAEVETVRALEAKGSVYSRELIVKKWCSMVALFTAGLELFSDRLPPLLEGRDQLSMREIIDTEVGHLREAFAREGEYTPKCAELPVTKKSAPRKKTSKRK